MHDVAVLDDVIFSLDSQFARVFNSQFRFMLNQVFQVIDFGANETSFEICMDCSRRLRGLRVFSDCPGPVFFASRGEEGDEFEQSIPSGDQAVESGFGLPQFFHKNHLLFQVFDFHNLAFQFSGQCHNR